MPPLDRFVAAQDPVWETVVAELAGGRKTTHWMWFVFPQLSGLGRSAMAERFGIVGPDEARAYLAHPLLGPRLEAAACLLLRHRDRPIDTILGSPDDLKLRSSMTLFARVGGGPQDDIFRAVLAAFYGGQEDPSTVDRLKGASVDG